MNPSLRPQMIQALQRSSAQPRFRTSNISIGGLANPPSSLGPQSGGPVFGPEGPVVSQGPTFPTNMPHGSEDYSDNAYDIRTGYVPGAGYPTRNEWLDDQPGGPTFNTPAYRNPGYRGGFDMRQEVHLPNFRFQKFDENTGTWSGGGGRNSIFDLGRLQI